MNLGTYSTFDCPTKKMDEAYRWLQAEFENIDGTVRKVMNPHDFGSYPSFEIDYPSELEFIDADEDYESEEDQRLAEKKDGWHDKVNAIKARYSKKFGAYL